MAVAVADAWVSLFPLVASSVSVVVIVVVVVVFPVPLVCFVLSLSVEEGVEEVSVCFLGFCVVGTAVVVVGGELCCRVGRVVVLPSVPVYPV